VIEVERDVLSLLKSTDVGCCFTCPTGQDTHVERVRSTKVPPGHVSHVRRAVSENLPGGQTMADDIQSIRFKERDKKLKGNPF
jgi:hypothetical protein